MMLLLLLLLLLATRRLCFSRTDLVNILRPFSGAQRMPLPK
jgi:hypothetical protein